MTRSFCSDAARLRGDDNIATAARVDFWILVELPTTWGHDPIRDAALPPSARESLEGASATIPRSRVVFIRRRVERLGASRIYVVRTNGGIAIRDLASIDELATVPLIDVAASLSSSVDPEVQPLVLVCTHGQHDSCCGRRGYPLFDALQRHGELDVWQCSHVGGDRFAANAVVLPWGLYYGPVEHHEAADLAASIARDEILLPAYRGRASFSRPVQAAETFIRRTTNLLSRDALRFHARETLLDGHMRVTLRDRHGTRHEVTIEHTLATDAILPTCKSKEPQPVREFRLIEYRTR